MFECQKEAYGTDMPGCLNHISLGKYHSPMYLSSLLKDKVEEGFGQVEGSKRVYWTVAHRIVPFVTE